MARPPKKGLDYFPKDVEFYNDFKIMDLLALHGPIGATVYEVILTEVYRNGYYLAEPIDRVATKVVRIIGNKWVQKRFVSQVILDCGDLGLFETTLLKHGVITSVGIQRRYATVTSRNKAIKEKYWLIDEDGQPLLSASKNLVTATGTGISATETRVNNTDIPQKESKGNETKQNNTISSELETSPRQDEVFRLLMIDGNYYSVTRDEIEKYRSLYPAVDVGQEFRKMIGWIGSHPKNRKTPRGISKFINSWLCRAQDSARPEKNREHAGKPSAPNRFHNFDQRDVNYDDMVKQQVTEWLHEQEGEKRD